MLSDSPIAYWRLGETSGFFATDSSGNGHTGGYLHGVTQGVTGALAHDANKAARFNGVQAEVAAFDNAALRLNGSWSIEFWARQISFVHTAPGILDKGNSATANGYCIQANSRGALTLVRNGKQVATGNGALTSTFRHFVVTYDGSRVHWYVNGSLVTTASITFPTNAGWQLFEIGKGDSGQFANDDIDEVALYSTALSASRVAAHYSAGS